MRLTKTYADGSYGVADDLPCGENSHEFKKMLIDKLGAYEELELAQSSIKATEIAQAEGKIITEDMVNGNDCKSGECS
jgi:hypothetical protein